MLSQSINFEHLPRGLVNSQHSGSKLFSAESILYKNKSLNSLVNCLSFIQDMIQNSFNQHLNFETFKKRYVLEFSLWLELDDI